MKRVISPGTPGRKDIFGKNTTVVDLVRDLDDDKEESEGKRQKPNNTACNVCMLLLKDRTCLTNKSMFYISLGILPNIIF